MKLQKTGGGGHSLSLSVAVGIAASASAWLWDGGPGHASDRIAGTGTLDLAGATFVPRFADGATGVLQMADGVTITGYDQMALPSSHKFKFKYTNGRLNLVRPGLIIYVK